MAEYDNTNRGALFSNRDKKREGKKDPDYKGRINVNGVDCWLSAWLEKSKDGVPYMSLSAQPMELRSEKSVATVEPKHEEAFNDEIPF